MLTFDFALYISLWFYSNASRRSAFQRFQRFLYIPLWFYSNHITMLVVHYNLSLHSTMVLFKSPPPWGMKSSLVLYIPLWFYSNIKANQNGSKLWLTLHSTMVLFKSPPPWGMKSSLVLYIPLWFYSNCWRQIRTWTKSVLYIPLWFYSNLVSVRPYTSSRYLYIPLWFYSNPNAAAILHNIYSVFTFHYGSIQICFFPCTVICYYSLHSTMVLFKLSPARP